VGFLFMGAAKNLDSLVGASKNLALLVFSVPNFSFWLKEGFYQ
jgi:hypothetical protein